MPTDDDIDAATDGWLVSEALRRLTPQHRGVVRALYHDALSVAEAARVLGSRPGP